MPIYRKDRRTIVRQLRKRGFPVDYSLSFMVFRAERTKSGLRNTLCCNIYSFSLSFKWKHEEKDRIREKKNKRERFRGPYPQESQYFTPTCAPTPFSFRLLFVLKFLVRARAAASLFFLIFPFFSLRSRLCRQVLLCGGPSSFLCKFGPL